MRRNIDGTCGSCCSNPNIRTINTMGADTQGNFTIRGDQGIHVTVGTNEIIISGIAVYYDNTDGNIVIDNDLMTINLADDITITGDMIIAGDLTVNGTYYTVHAEHVYTEDDYIIMRGGAVTGLGSGDYSGFQVTKYDGTNDGRLVIDNSGTARVGDVGDEQPLLTREESANLNDGALLKWDAANSKAVDEGTVGSDTKPIKIVNGVATAVTDDLLKNVIGAIAQATTAPGRTGAVYYARYGKTITVLVLGLAGFSANLGDQLGATDLPPSHMGNFNTLMSSADGATTALCYVDTSGNLKFNIGNTVVAYYGSFMYLSQ